MLKIATILESSQAFGAFYSVIGSGARVNWESGNYAYHYLGGGAYPYQDQVGRLISRAEDVSRPYSVTEINSGLLSPTMGLNRIGLEPEKFSRMNAVGSPWAAYVHHAVELLSGSWNFASRQIPDTEKAVSHFNVSGSLYEFPTTQSFHRIVDPTDPAHESFTGLYVRPSSSPGWSAAFESTGFIQDDWGSSYVYPETSCLQQCKNIHEAIIAQPLFVDTAGYKERYGNFVYTVDGFSIPEIKYSIVSDYLHGGMWYRMGHFVRHTRSFELFDTIPYGWGGYIRQFLRYNVSVATGMTYLTTWAETDSPPPVVFANPGISVAYSTQVCDPFFAWPSAPCGRADELLGFEDGKYRRSHNRCFATYISRAMDLQKDLYALAFKSTKDAVDTYYSSVSSNHIEFLAELNDLASPIDVAKNFNQVSARVFAQPLPKPLGRKLGVLRSLLSVLADAKLVYSLAIAPTFRDALDTAKKAESILSRFSSLIDGKPEELRGKFSLQVPEELSGFPGTFAVARSKVIVQFHPDSYLTGLFKLRAWGLLPSLSSLWDLLPWSFVLDWATHTGAQLDEVDASFMLNALDVVYSVHSVKLGWNFDPDTLAEYDVHIPSRLSSDSTIDGYVFYDRWAAQFLPQLSPTRLPLWGPSEVPDWTLLGALIYKLL